MGYVAVKPMNTDAGEILPGTPVKADTWPNLAALLRSEFLARVPVDMERDFCAQAKEAPYPPALIKGLPHECHPAFAAQLAMKGDHPARPRGRPGKAKRQKG